MSKNVVTHRVNRLPLLFLLTNSITYAANAQSNAEHCTTPSDGTYRIGGDGKDHVFESFQNPNICWGNVNKIVIAPRQETKTDVNDEYKYIRLVLSHITKAREDKAKELLGSSNYSEALKLAQSPLLITNGLSQYNYENGSNADNTQVKVGGRFYYSFSIQGGTNWKLSGTGDLTNYPGHYPANIASYNNTQGKYGFVIDGYFVKNRNALGVEGYTTRDSDGNVIETKPASNFEIEFIEIARAGFAGMHIKTERRNPGGIPLDNTAYTMRNIRIHDNYIHDSVGEGLYIGSTSESKLQHAIEGITIWNNRVVRTGAEAMQVGQLEGYNKIFNNVFGPSATKWRAPFQMFQDGAIQLDHRTGVTEFYQNIVMGASNTLLLLADNHVGVPQTGDGVFIKDNYFSGTRYLGAYIKAPNTKEGTEDLYGHIPTFRFEGNVWRNQSFERDDILPNTSPPEFLHQTHNTQGNIEFVNERWTGANSGTQLNLISQLPSGNGSSGNISGTNNQRASDIPAAEFVSINSLFGLQGSSSQLDELNIEVYAKFYGANVGTAGETIHYPFGQVVMTQQETNWDAVGTVEGGDFYQCTIAEGCSGISPEEDTTQSVWKKIVSPYLAAPNNQGLIDNLVTQVGSDYAKLGIQLSCDKPKEFSILPIQGAGQHGSRYFPFSKAIDTQQHIFYDNNANTIIPLTNYTENETVFFYSDSDKGRTAYLDFGTNYKNLRILEAWTRYAKWSMRMVNGINTPHTGFKTLTWVKSLEDAQGIEENEINFHSATIKQDEQHEAIWKPDLVKSNPITPKGRYLVLESYPLSTDYDYSRAIEVALVGWVAAPSCAN